MEKLNYIEAASFKTESNQTKPEAMVVLCLLNPSVGSHRAESLTREIVSTLGRLLVAPSRPSGDSRWADLL
jgi:hypothetical protein